MADRSNAGLTRWRGKAVSLDQIVAAVNDLHRAHQRDGARHALARTLNLIIAPSSGGGAGIDAALVALEAHSPSRTLMLCSHGSDRLDAEAILECRLADAAGTVGVCHDRVVLTADDARLKHAASLVAPLLLSDLPTVLWFPEPASPIPDPRLLERAQHVLVDSADDGAPLWRMAELARRVRVHDLAGGGSSSGGPPRRRRSSPLSDVACCRGSRASRSGTRETVDRRRCCLPVGSRPAWVAARADRARRRPDAGQGRPARRRRGWPLAVGRPRGARCGGIETITFPAGSDDVQLSRGAATSRPRDLFAEALQPVAVVRSRLPRCAHRRRHPGGACGSRGRGERLTLRLEGGADRAAEVAERGDQHRGRRGRHRTGAAASPRAIRFAYGSPRRVAEPAADDHRLDVEQVQRGRDAGAERLHRPVDQRRSRASSSLERARPDRRSSAGRGRASS